jgi:hypothetical protein
MLSNFVHTANGCRKSELPRCTLSHEKRTKTTRTSKQIPHQPCTAVAEETASMSAATPKSGICPTEVSTFAEEALSGVTGKSKIQCKLRVKRHPESVSPRAMLSLPHTPFVESMND